jgi:large exoprotein involved in heme utilization and adhesion
MMTGGHINADSTGTGLTGNITITAGDRIMMNDGIISTRALTSDGGNITLKAPQVMRLEGAQITTSVQSGSGGGGNIMIDPQFLIVNNSTITANAFGGPGGNITIIADNFLASSTTLLEASSALSTPGVIQIRSPENNVAGSIAQLPRAFVDASRLLRGACSARREGAPSSFVLAGRGGVPAEADGYLPSTIISAPPTALTLAHLDDCAR